MHCGSSHVFSEIYIHLNWHCLNNQPLITPQLEVPLYRFMKEQCQKVKGLHFIALNGTPTHIHLAFQMEPFVTISEFVGKIKGASSFDINKSLGRKALQWQRGYGAVSFTRLQIPVIERYIEKQKEHHGVGGGAKLNPTLENCGEYDDGYDQAAVDARL